MRAAKLLGESLTALGHPRRLSQILFVVGFVFAGAAGLLAIAMPWYASAVGGYAFYDPVSRGVCRWGVLLSFLGLAFATTGAWRSGPHRFRVLAPACAAVMLMFWLLQLSTAYE
jgi:hypothetical protein